MKWKNIWENRNSNFEAIDMTDAKAVFLELKRIDGFDVVGGGIPYISLVKQNDGIVERLSNGKNLKSIFEVGCGCGANLYLLMNAGYEIGGIDYSSGLIDIAKKIFQDFSRELICDEAINLPIDLEYDALFSNSVFSYFPSEKYTLDVLDKMFAKTKFSIGLIDVHDIEKKEKFIAYRRANVEDYDTKYKDLEKTFYSKDLFRDWAIKNNCEVEFYASNVFGYWNSDFVFDVYFYKR